MARKKSRENGSENEDRRSKAKRKYREKRDKIERMMRDHDIAERQKAIDGMRDYLKGKGYR